MRELTHSNRCFSRYSLCWAEDAVDPADPTQHLATVGTLTLHGPVLDGVVGGTLGKACTIELTGPGLRAENVFAVASDCSDGESAVRVFGTRDTAEDPYAFTVPSTDPPEAAGTCLPPPRRKTGERDSSRGAARRRQGTRGGGSGAYQGGGASVRAGAQRSGGSAAVRG